MTNPDGYYVIAKKKDSTEPYQLVNYKPLRQRNLIGLGPIIQRSDDLMMSKESAEKALEHLKRRGYETCMIPFSPTLYVNLASIVLQEETFPQMERDALEIIEEIATDLTSLIKQRTFTP